MLTAFNQGASFFGFHDRPLRVLAVDDDPIMREYATLNLSGPNVVIDLAADGMEAFEKLDQNPYDLALFDLHMPRLDGLGLLMKIRAKEKFANLPVVMVTSRSDVFAIDRAFELGATAFTTKPINWPLLCYELRYVLRASAVEAELRLANERSAKLLEAQANVLRLLQHETRTPMNAIVGFAALLSEQSDGPLGHKNYQDYSEILLGSAQRLDRTLSDLNLLARLQAPSVELETDDYFLASLLAIALDGMPPALRGTAGTIIVDPSVSIPYRIRCNADLFTRALQAILTNALTHGAGAQPCSVSFAVDGAGAGTLMIRDHGPGIKADAMPDLQAPFAETQLSLNRSSEGLGIGLGLANRIVALHGGEISLSPADGGGLTVQIVLPAAMIAATSLESKVA